MPRYIGTWAKKSGCVVVVVVGVSDALGGAVVCVAGTGVAFASVSVVVVVVVVLADPSRIVLASRACAMVAGAAAATADDEDDSVAADLSARRLLPAKGVLGGRSAAALVLPVMPPTSVPSGEPPVDAAFCTLLALGAVAVSHDIGP